MTLLHPHHHHRRRRRQCCRFFHHSQWHIFFLLFDDTGINNDDYGLLFLSVSFSYTVYAIDAAKLRFSFRFSSPSSSPCYCRHPYRRKNMWKNTTMGNFSLFSHDNDFQTIIVVEVSLCIVSRWQYFSSLKECMGNALNRACNSVLFMFHFQHCSWQI